MKLQYRRSRPYILITIIVVVITLSLLVAALVAGLPAHLTAYGGFLPGLIQAIDGTGITIRDSAIARAINTSTNQPIGRTTSFLVNDSTVYSWLELVNVPPPTHNLTWVWLTPQGHRYSRGVAVTPDPGQGTAWRTLDYYSGLKLQGKIAAQIPGTWQVAIYIDGKRSLTQSFSVSDLTAPAQPLRGWTWPPANIKVYIQPQPAYAKIDALNAMKQWNFSQAWFEKTYTTSSRPIYALIATNDTSAPVGVIFNKTVTIAYTSNAITSFSLNANGSFKSVKCQISVVLSLKNGTLTDDTFIQNSILFQLGGCLGLGQVYRTGDAMNPFAPNAFDVNYPSTMNLYSLYEISGLNNITSIPLSYSLPASIPYTKSPQYTGASPGVAVPTSWIVAVAVMIALVTGFSVVIIKKRRSRPAVEQDNYIVQSPT